MYKFCHSFVWFHFNISLLDLSDVEATYPPIATELWFSRIFNESRKFSRWKFWAMAFFTSFNKDDAKTVFPMLGWIPVNHKTFLSLNVCHLQYIGEMYRILYTMYTVVLLLVY